MIHRRTVPRATRASVAVAALSLALASGALAGVPAPPPLIDRTLANGLRVTILPDSSLPIVSTRVFYHVGSANEAKHERGFAHLFEHLMFGGTQTREKGVWENHHHRCGGYDNAHTGWDETVYESDIPAAGFDSVLVMEADRMVNLRLDQPTLDNEKRIVTEELRMRSENDPVDRVMVAGLRALCGDHPYAVSPLGTKEEIAAATLDRARQFYDRYYRPRNAHLIVVGPVEGAATMRRVEELFGSLPASGVTPPDVPSLEGWKFPERIRLHEDIPPVEVGLLVFPLPPPISTDNAALIVLSEMLTGGQVDQFREDLVHRRHQALEAGGQSLSLRRGGVLCFYSAVLPYRRESGQFKVMDESMAELARMQWLTDDGLAGCKSRILRRVENQTYLAGRRADALGENLWWRGDARLAFEQADRVAAVTRADVKRVYARYVLDVRPIRIYVQPEKVPILLKLFGWILPWFIK